MVYKTGKFDHLSKYMEKDGKPVPEEYQKIKFKSNIGKSLIHKEINRTSKNLIILNSIIIFFSTWFLVEKDYTDGEYLGIIISLLLLSLGFLNIKKGFNRIADITTSKPYKQLASLGDPELSIERIEDEVKNGFFLINNNSKLTKSWIIYSGFLSLDFTKLDRTAWVYKKVTKHYRNFIPVGKSYEIIINTLNGTTSLPIKNQRGDELISELSRLAPWIVLGYSDDLNRIWGKDRARFLSAVEERKSVTC